MRRAHPRVPIGSCAPLCGLSQPISLDAKPFSTSWQLSQPIFERAESDLLELSGTSVPFEPPELLHEEQVCEVEIGLPGPTLSGLWQVAHSLAAVSERREGMAWLLSFQSE